MAKVLAVTIVTTKPSHARVNMVPGSDCTSKSGRDLQIGQQKLKQCWQTDLFRKLFLFASFAIKLLIIDIRARIEVLDHKFNLNFYRCS